jgi:hypothetical protein
MSEYNRVTGTRYNARMQSNIKKENFFRNVSTNIKCVRTNEEAIVIAGVETHLKNEEVAESVAIRPGPLDAVLVVVNHCEEARRRQW